MNNKKRSNWDGAQWTFTPLWSDNLTLAPAVSNVLRICVSPQTLSETGEWNESHSIEKLKAKEWKVNRVKSNLYVILLSRLFKSCSCFLFVSSFYLSPNVQLRIFQHCRMSLVMAKKKHRRTERTYKLDLRMWRTKNKQKKWKTTCIKYENE